MNPVDHPHGGGEGKKSGKEELLGESLLKKETQVDLKIS
jgi:ribosomal protein L2